MSTRVSPRFLPLATLALAACGTISTGQYRSMTAGVIGCPAQEITVSEQKNVVWGGQGIVWRAQCRGHRFICSHSGATSCKEELQPAGGEASPAAKAPTVAR